MWYVNEIGNRAWMTDGGVAIPMDYDGDGTTDLGVYSPSNHYWYIHHLSGPTIYYAYWGIPGDIPVVGDFDGDGSADLTTFYNTAGQAWWWILYSSKPYYYSNFSAQTTDSIVVGATGY